MGQSNALYQLQATLAPGNVATPLKILLHTIRAEAGASFYGYVQT